MQENQQNKKENQSKKVFVLQKILADRITNKLASRITIVVIILLIILRIVLYFTLPPYFLHEHSDDSCTANFQQMPGKICETVNIQETQYWTSNIDNIQKEDMFVVVQGVAFRNPSETEYVVFDLPYEYKYFELKPQNNFKAKQDPKQQDGPHGLNQDNHEQNYDKRIIELYCPKNEIHCRFNDYIFVQNLKGKNLQLEIQLLIPEDKRQMFQSFHFTIWKGNKKIGRILTAFQYTFFAVSFLMAIVYILHYCKIEKKDRSFEHTNILILSISLVLFNNPFYVLSLYHSSTFFQVLGTIFICLFFILAFHFWVVVGRRVEHKEFKVNTIYADIRLKAALFLTFLLLVLPASVYNTSDELHPAFYGHGAISMLLLIALILAVLSTGGFWIYILILFCQNLSTKRHVPQRYRTLIFVSVIFFVYMVFNFMTGFYHYNPQLPGRNIVYLFAVNLYVFFLQVMWRVQDGCIKISEQDEQPEDSEKTQKEFVLRDFERGQSEPYENRDVEQDHFNLEKLGLEEEKVDQNETGEIEERETKPTNLKMSKLDEERKKYDKRKSHEFKY